MAAVLLGLTGCGQIIGLDGLTDLPSDAAAGPNSGDGGPSSKDGAARPDSATSMGQGADGSSGSDGAGASDDGAASDDGSVAGDAAAATPQLSVASPALTFGTVTVGQTLSPGTIKVTNTGTATTAALTDAITGAAFSVMTDGCAGMTLAPNAYCQITIVLDDSTAQTDSGTFTVTDTPSDTVTVNLQADVLTPGALSIAPQTNNFQSWLIGASSPSQTFVVSNTGSVATGTLTATLTPTNGTTAAEYALSDSCTGHALTGSATCNLSVVFTPSGRGTRTATIAVTASPGGTATSMLTGTGLAAASLSIAPAPTPFATTMVGTSGAQQTFTVTNGGDVTSPGLTTTIAPGSNTTASEFANTGDTCNGNTVAGGASCAVTVQFDPATYGPKAATLTVAGGAAGSPSVGLTGTGEDTLVLTIAKNGSGGGTVTDASQAINCGSTCSAGFTRITSDPIVGLSAVANPTSTFTGWSGGGCGTSPSCSVTLSQATTVTATFAALQEQLVVNFRAIGAGQASAAITSSPAGISCTGPVCSTSAIFDIDTPVTLTVSGIASGSLTGWLPTTCSGTTCAVTLTANTTIDYTATTNNIVFVTSGQTTGDIGGLSGADAFCAAAATNVGFPGKYVAWLASSSTTAVSRLGSARGWIRPDGQPFADTIGTSGGTTGLINGQIYFPPDINETGATWAPTVWAATEWGQDVPDEAMAGTFDDCSGWTSASSALIAEDGNPSDGSQDWASTYFAVYCNSDASLYCMGTNLSTAVTPATTTGRHAFVTNADWSPSSGIAAGDTLCQNEASSAGLANPTHFMALLATETATAISRFNQSGANWIRPDGLPVASSVANFVAGTFLVPISQFANGSYLGTASEEGESMVWTGAANVTTAGSASTTCNNWSTVSASATGEAGFASSTNSSFFGSWASQPCSYSSAILCLEN